MDNNTNKKIKVLRKEERSCDNRYYTYELKESEGCLTASYKMPLYSIGVKMIDSDGKNRYVETKDIFSDIRKATDFFDKIVRNLATPIDLAYIVEDEMCNI